MLGCGIGWGKCGEVLGRCEKVFWDVGKGEGRCEEVCWGVREV